MNINLNKIKKVSRRYRIFFSIILVLTPIIPIFLYLISNELPTFMRGEILKNHNIPIALELSLQTRILAGCVSLITSIITVLGIYTLIKLFRLYEKGEIFTKQNVNYYRKLGYIMIMSMFAEIIHNSLLSIVLTLENGPGNRILTVSLSSNELTKLVVGLLVILISYIMDVGRKIQEEQQLTI